ncbi:hypothetical protein IWT30_00469 [Secundilactobacillus mixtipabuli]|uniref:Uncharacterized protein n=1 Tax=Secundilactobacillus mixtipabuli TaxID=1435342 RepID=A0A1Z5I9X2_9LACO|nr:hypothetical protein IWT30_00469 [Secundilactobacillus mixtipabuli]
MIFARENDGYINSDEMIAESDDDQSDLWKTVDE